MVDNLRKYNFIYITCISNSFTVFSRISKQLYAQFNCVFQMDISQHSNCSACWSTEWVVCSRQTATQYFSDSSSFGGNSWSRHQCWLRWRVNLLIYKLTYLMMLSWSALSLVNFGERTFSYSGPAAWNSLPPCLQLTTNTKSFKRQLKTHLFTEAF